MISTVHATPCQGCKKGQRYAFSGKKSLCSNGNSVISHALGKAPLKNVKVSSDSDSDFVVDSATESEHNSGDSAALVSSDEDDEAFKATSSSSSKRLKRKTPSTISRRSSQRKQHTDTSDDVISTYRSFFPRDKRTSEISLLTCTTRCLWPCRCTKQVKEIDFGHDGRRARRSNPDCATS